RPLLPRLPVVELILRQAELGEEAPPEPAEIAATLPGCTHAVAQAHQAPSGVRSPSRPSGRKTRIRISTAKISEFVQSVPGVCHSRPLLNCSISPMQIAPS